jgi:hypothetical protein
MSFYHQQRPCKQLTPTRALMLAWPVRGHPIAIISHSATRKLSPRHSSSLFDVHEPRLRLGHGKLGKYSRRLRRVRTTRRTSQAFQNEQSNPATRRLPQLGVTTRLQCVLTDNDVRRDVPATKHCTFLTSPCAPPLATIKGRGGQWLQGLDLRKAEHHLKGLGLDTLSRPACNPYYEHS